MDPIGMTPGWRRFPIRFTGANRSMAIIGITPSRCYVDVGDSAMRVRMGWAFSADVPRASVRSAVEDHERVLGWGVHGWRGRWLVNGSASGIVRIEIEPARRARVLIFPVHLRVLRVSVDQPATLVDLLTGADR